MGTGYGTVSCFVERLYRLVAQEPWLMTLQEPVMGEDTTGAGLTMNEKVTEAVRAVGVDESVTVTMMVVEAG